MKAYDEIRTRLNKLDLIRTFYNEFDGNFKFASVLYTNDSTCMHTVFDSLSKTGFKCRECPCIITTKQVILN